MSALASFQSAIADRYRLDREIGRGGMAEVYLALDLRHQRPVAIKILAAELGEVLGRERFLREIRIAAGLNHPHVLAIHDSGEAAGRLYYVTPYIEGESLRARLQREPQLPVGEAVRLAGEIAEALGYAHARGVIHRDVKPENILLTEGHALVADFGLARPVHAETGAGAMTGPGFVIGTPAYMSPEQSLGGTVDGRADLYALACTVYEMLAGQPPFAGASVEAILARHLVDPVPSLRTVRPGISEALERAVLKALAKAPADRQAGPAEFAAELRLGGADGRTSPVTRGPERIRSLVVLPLENRSADPEEEFFADGMTEALITDLAKLRALRVISRTSAMRYKGTGKALGEIAAELGVDAVLEGSVQRSSGRIRITVGLVEARTDSPLWAERYDREIRDVLALQSDVARAISREIKLTLSPQEEAQLDRGPVNPKALEAYLKGRFHWAKRTEGAFRSAIGHFEESIARDPDYAPPYTGLADVHILLVEYGIAAPEEGFAAARKAALRALELDESASDAHNSVAYIQLLHDWDWEASERSFRLALQHGPSSTTHLWYSRFLLAMGRWTEAEAQLETALGLDPLSLILNAERGHLRNARRDFQGAALELRKVVEMEPGFPVAHLNLGIALLLQGNHDEACAEFEQARVLLGNALAIAGIGLAHAGAGRRPEALATLAELRELSTRRYVPTYLFAVLQAGLGDTDAAFASLEEAFRVRHGWMVRLCWDPLLDPLRSDPRFDDLVRRVGLPASGR